MVYSFIHAFTKQITLDFCYASYQLGSQHITSVFFPGTHFFRWVCFFFRFSSALLNAGYRVSSSHTEMNLFKTDAPISFIWDVYLAYRNRTKTDKQMNSGLEGLSSDEGNSDEKLHSDSDDGVCTATVPVSSESSRQRKRRLRRSKDNGDPTEGSQDARNEDGYRFNRRDVRAKLVSRPPNSQVDFTLHPLANPPSRVAGLVRYVLFSIIRDQKSMKCYIIL